MKAQPRKGALTESTVNLVVGFGFAWLINYFVLPLLGMHPSTTDLFSLGGVFTLASVVRSYILRRVFERWRHRNIPPDFLYIAEELAAERKCQIEREGYSLAHDDGLTAGEMARAAATYLWCSVFHINSPIVKRVLWPWAMAKLKSAPRRRHLVKAGALIIAEIGRLDRAATARRK